MSSPVRHIQPIILGLLFGMAPALASELPESPAVPGRIDESLFRDSDKIGSNWWRESQGDDRTSLNGFAIWIAGEIRQQIHCPSFAHRHNQQGTVQVALNFDADGRLAAIEIVESSGYEILDMEALRSVRAIDPMDVPLEFRGKPVRAVVPIAFRLQYDEQPPNPP